MGLLSLSFTDGVFSLKLDFAFWRRRPAKKKRSSLAERGPVPLPPPFALPPPVRSAVPFEVLVSAPALRDSDLVRKYTAPEQPRHDDAVTRAPEVTRSSDATMLDGDDEHGYQPAKTDLARQRRDVRKALRDLTV